MPHGKGTQSTRKNPREESSKEEDFELEIDPTAREDTLSPLYSTSSSAGSVASGSSVPSVSSEQLQMILAANSKSMEASILSIISTMTPSAGSVAPTPSIASAPPPAAAPRAQVKVPLWSEDESPTNFFSKVEKALTLNGVPRSQWGQNIHVQLTGRAQDALAQVPLVSIEDYDVIKTTVLDALGDTPEFADRGWWSLSRKTGEDAYEFYLRIRACCILRLQGLSTKEEILEKLVLSRFLSLLPADSYDHAANRCPKDGSEAAKLVQQLEQRRAYSRDKQGWRHHHSGRREHSRGSGSYGSGGSSGSQGSNSHGGRSSSPNISGSSPTRPNSTNGTGAEEVTDGNPSAGAPASGGSGHNSGRHDRGSRRQVICHSCGEAGHIRPNCPHRIRRVKSHDPSFVYLVDGLINGSAVPGMSIDTGADRTLVREDFISEGAYTGDTVSLDSWRGAQVSQHKVALVTLEVEGVRVKTKVAVVSNLEFPALLGKDLGRKMGRKLMSIVLKHMDDSDSDSDVTEVPKQSENTVVTKQQVEFEVVSVTRAPSECKPVALAVVLDSPEAYSEPGVVIENHEFIDELELDQNSPEDDDTPVILGDVFGFSDALFSADSPVELGEVFDFSDSLFEPEDPVPTPVQVLEVCPVGKPGSSCFGYDNSDVEVILREDCVAVQPLDDLSDFSDSSVGYDSLVGLGDVLDILDQFFVPMDPVPTPVKMLEVLPVGRTDIECPLPVLKEVNFVEDSLVVQPPAPPICVRMEVKILDCSDSGNLVEECVVGLPPVDFGSVVSHSLLDGMAENLGSAADPLGVKQVELVKLQGMGGTPVLEVPSVAACTEIYNVVDEGFKKIYAPGAKMLVGLRSLSRSEIWCMSSVTPDKSVSAWSISYSYWVRDRGKDAKSEGVGSSVKMCAACHGFCAWAAALQLLETRCLHLGPLHVTKATRDSFSDEVSCAAFVLLIVISVFEYFYSVPLFAILTTDWAEFSKSGATCVSPMAALCAVEKQEKQLAVFFLIDVPEDPPSRMPEAPAAYEGTPTSSLPVSSTDEGGGDVMESPSLAAASHNI